jgi:hypothetical protein
MRVNRRTQFLLLRASGRAVFTSQSYSPASCLPPESDSLTRGTERTVFVCVAQGASEQAEQLSSLAAEVRLLETELQALIAPSAPDTVSANSVVAGVAAKSKKKVWDWKMMNPIKWLKSAWGMTTGVGALGEEEEERAVEPHTVLGSEPYQIEATHTGRRLLGQDR